MLRLTPGRRLPADSVRDLFSKRMIVFIVSVLLEDLGQAFQLFVVQPFDAYITVLSRAGENELVEFRVQRPDVPVLRVLKDEDHQKGDDRRAGIDDELPRFGKTEDGACEAPYGYRYKGEDKDRRAPGIFRHRTCKPAETIGLWHQVCHVC